MILSERYHYSADYLERSRLALETALAKAPIYRDWQKCDPGPQAPLDSRYDALPELTKQALRAHFPLGLVTTRQSLEEAIEREEITYTFTSGTTEEKVVNLWNPGWWERGEAAAWQLNANTARLAYPQREAKLASALNVGIHCEDDLPMASRILGRTLYLNEKISLISWRASTFRRMARELAEYQPTVLEANSSLLARLAFWAMDEGVELYSPAVIILTFELPSQIHLAAIRKVFRSPLISSFGTTETGFVLQQCEAGLFHQNTDFCHIDFQPIVARHGGPELGRILVSTFGNPWSAILRFDTGDLIRLHPQGRCGCGREHGLIVAAIEGRVANALFSTTGALVTPLTLDTQLATIPEIRDYQLVQHTATHYDLTVLFSPSSGSLPLVHEQIKDTLAAIFGADGTYAVNPVTNILPGPAGKFRRTQANIPFDPKELFA